MAQIRKGVYQHFKGKTYAVIGEAKHSEMLEDFVVYRALYKSSPFGKHPLWVRPKKSFEALIEREEKTVQRFTFLKQRPVRKKI
jgi:hypothetical protein